MRVNGTLSYILSDHLGSTSIITDASGYAISDTKYKAWGEERYSSGTNPSKYTYTGQYSHTADFGLMFYNARWYDPSLGRFTSADTIVPDGVQGYDRYAYVSNNPLRYVDPTGYDPIPDFITGFLYESTRTLAWFSPKHQEALTVQPNESNAMLAGRVVADIASILFGSILAVDGTAAAIGGAAECIATIEFGCTGGAGAVVAVAGAAVAVEGIGMGARGAEGLARIAAMSGNSNSSSMSEKQILKSIRTLEKRIAEHKAKLQSYIENPDAFDNLGFLKRVIDPEIRESIIQGRINHLQSEIANWESQIEILTEQLGQLR